jgi:hypothetical protein
VWNLEREITANMGRKRKNIMSPAAKLWFSEAKKRKEQSKVEQVDSDCNTVSERKIANHMLEFSDSPRSVDSESGLENMDDEMCENVDETDSDSSDVHGTSDEDSEGSDDGDSDNDSSDVSDDSDSNNEDDTIMSDGHNVPSTNSSN